MRRQEKKIKLCVYSLGGRETLVVVLVVVVVGGVRAVLARLAGLAWRHVVRPDVNREWFSCGGQTDRRDDTGWIRVLLFF